MVTVTRSRVIGVTAALKGGHTVTVTPRRSTTRSRGDPGGTAFLTLAKTTARAVTMRVPPNSVPPTPTKGLT